MSVIDVTGGVIHDGVEMFIATLLTLMDADQQLNDNDADTL